MDEQKTIKLMEEFVDLEQYNKGFRAQSLKLIRAQKSGLSGSCAATGGVS